MAAGYKAIMAEHDGIAPVGDTFSAITFDLEEGEIVLIVADQAAAGGFLPRLMTLGIG